MLNNGQVRAGSYKAGNGTVGLPSYRFTDDLNSGIYRGDGGTNPIGFLRFSTNSTEAITINPTQNVGIGITIPTSKLHSGGSFATAIARLSGVNTLNETHHTIILTGNSTITLPSAIDFSGRMYIIKNSSYTVTITGAGYVDLVGAPSTTIIGIGETITLQSDGIEWQQIN